MIDAIGFIEIFTGEIAQPCSVELCRPEIEPFVEEPDRKGVQQILSAHVFSVEPGVFEKTHRFHCQTEHPVPGC